MLQVSMFCMRKFWYWYNNWYTDIIGVQSKRPQVKTAPGQNGLVSASQNGPVFTSQNGSTNIGICYSKKLLCYNF